MSHCVPDWDGHDGELDAIIATTDFLPPVNAKWGSSLLPKSSPASDLASLQSSDVPSGWTESGPEAPKPVGNDEKSPDWQVNCNNWTTGRQHTEDEITSTKVRTSEPPLPVSDGVLAVNVPVIDPTLSNSIMADDEMVSWLNYPLEDRFEKDYCSEFFGELPNSSVNSMQAIKDSLAVGQQQFTTVAGKPNCLATGGMNGSMNRTVSADAAMAMGAGRAAGVLPQAGVEVFTKVRTQQPYAGKWSPNNNGGVLIPGRIAAVSSSPPAVQTSLNQHQLHLPLRAQPPRGVASSGFANISSSLLPPTKAQVGLLQDTTLKKGTMNFSHFSTPAANIKASLQGLGMSHGSPGENRPKTFPDYHPNMPSNGGSRPYDVTTSSGSSIAESTTTRLHNAEASRNDSAVRAMESSSAEGGQQPSSATESSWPSSMQNSLSSRDAEGVKSTAGVGAAIGNHIVNFDLRPADPYELGPLNRQNSNDRSNAAITLSAEKVVTPPPRNPEPPELTVTSSSGGSGNTSKGVSANLGKRRSREREDSEIQSDEAEDEVIELKKPQQRSNPAKRTRAAEVHNLSERRRRDRINERMKALQELIPNSNKADKASMLDEAIEYLKMLQCQLQMMSLRSGMSIPSLIPNGMQHLQVPQMGGMPPMGMGMGMGIGGLGMGMGPMVGLGGMGPMGPMGHMLDMNSMAAAGRPPSHLMPHLSHAHGGAASHGISHSGSSMMGHQMPVHAGAPYNVSQVMPHHPSHGGSSHNVSATSPAVSMVDSQDLRLQSNTASALQSVYLERQHPLQLTPQTMDVYNAYMIHQQQQQHPRQQQQHQQQQHQQHQQQQQQLHHMSNTMGGGGLQ